MSNALYRELKQYIHNELKITREDIQEMIRECVAQEIQKILNDPSNYNTFLGNQINEYLTNNDEPYKKPFYTRFAPKSLDQVIYDTVVDQVSKTVKERVIVTLKEPRIQTETRFNTVEDSSKSGICTRFTTSEE